MIKKVTKITLIITLLFLIGCNKDQNDINIPKDTFVNNTNTHPLVMAARNQIGVVTNYDTNYYLGGYPPENSGACTDVIGQALLKNGYDLKAKIDKDMTKYPERYPTTNDPNINFRRVANIKIFLDNYAMKLSTKTDTKNLIEWQGGDIVTYDQIPGSLWHIAIVSDKKNNEGVPLLIHNYGIGVIENDYLTKWPAPITGHYRLQEFIK